MPQVIVFITRLWNNNNNKKISLTFNSTQSTTSPADFNGRLRAGGELCSTNTQSPAKTVPPPYHTGSSCATLPTNGFFTPKAPKSHVRRPPRPQSQRRLFPACRHVPHEAQGREQGVCFHRLRATCRLCVVGLYSLPANTPAGNAAGRPLPMGAGRKKARGGNLKRCRGRESVEGAPQPPPGMGLGFGSLVGSVGT